MILNCSNCPYWIEEPRKKGDKNRWGHCYRFPPPAPQLNPRPKGPTEERLLVRTYADEGCGEHPEIAQAVKTGKDLKTLTGRG